MYSHRFLYLAVLALILTAAVPVFASGFWTPPVYHPELNSGANAADGSCLSADGLTIYFSRYVPSLGAGAIFTATRPDLDSAFGPQTMIAELFNGRNVGSPWISADGLRLYYHERMLPDDRAYIRMAIRNDLTQPWVVVRCFEDIHQTGYFDIGPALTADELVLAFGSDRPGMSAGSAIWIAVRNSVDEPFGAPVLVSEINAIRPEAPWLTPDGLTLYFSGHPVSDPTNDIYKATRISRALPFTDIRKLEPFATLALGEQAPCLTPDERILAFHRVVPSDSASTGICTSYWFEPQIGYELLDGNYSAEIVASYRRNSGKLGYPYGMEFGPDGSLYITNQGAYSSELTDGTIYKVAQDGTVSLFASGFTTPCDIVWGGGTAYGDYFYVADEHVLPRGRIAKVSLSGAKSTFATPDSHPLSLALDRVGLYGGQLYTATCTRDHVYTLSPAGAITKFSDFPYNDDPGWGVASMVFAPQGDYMGLMYAITFGVTPAGPDLLYTLDTAGNPSPIVNSLASGGQMHFDTTAQQYFGGGLFARAVLSGDPSPRSIFYVSPSGETLGFIRKAAPDMALCGFTFGPDGAMYVAEYNGKYDVTIISRILPAGPYFTALNNLGLASAAKKRAIADVDTAVASEKLALRALIELGRRPTTDIMSRRAILKATQKVTVAKAQEEVALMLLRKSLPLVNEAWEILIEQVAPDVDPIAEPPVGPVRWPPVQNKPGK